MVTISTMTYVFFEKQAAWIDPTTLDLDFSGKYR